MSHRLRALITGGAGFLGSHLCDRLIVEGFEVICLDNLLTGSLENIRHLLDNPRFTFINHDVTKPINLDDLSRSDTQLDFVLHFASPASPKDYAQYPIHTLKVGALGTYHALGLAKAKSAVFLLASSSEVYGDPQVSPQPETYWGNVNPVGPRSVYDEAKRFAEAITIAYHNAHGLDVRIARIFNTYGPRMRQNDGRALPTFITQALRNEPLTVYGDGSQTRSFCYVDDMIEGIFRLILVGQTDESLNVNLGNPDEASILQLAHEIVRLSGSSSPITFYPLPPDDPKIRRPDISKARRILGWTPGVSREDGLHKAISYFQDRLGVTVS